MFKALATLALISMLSGPASPATENDEGKMLVPHVSVSDPYVVFSYAGDLWRVSRNGGAAEHLTAGPEEDDFPVFAPDGLSVAFSRRGADDWDVYTIPVQGGEARRLTWNPEADIARAWTADGARVLFTSHRDEESVFRMYAIGTDESLPVQLPLPQAWDASVSPAGDRIAYVPISLLHELGGTEWRYYRGGRVSRIAIVPLDGGAVEELPPTEANDRNPMWVGETIYFVSDRSGTFNLHAYDPRTREIEQLTSYETYGIDDAAAGAGIIVFVQDGHIRVLDTLTRDVTTLEIQVEPDRSELESRTVDGARFIQSASPSPTGDRIVFGARGEVMVLDVESGVTRNLTNTPGAAERYPVMSPDGKWIAFFSDESGEYQLQVRPTGDEERPRTIPVELQSSFYRELVWSPDSKRLAFTDKRLRLWVADVETGGARRVTTSTYSYQDRYQPSWSPDGVWLAYSRYESNRLRAIYLYNAERGRQRRITHGRVSAEHPVFDSSGRYLYFVASSTASLGDFGWSVLSGLLLRPYSARRLHVVSLQENVPPPVFPITGDPNPEAGALTPPPPGEIGARPADRPGPGAGPGVQRANVGLQNIESRVVPLPLPQKDYTGLFAGQAGVLYVLVTEWPPSPTFGSEPTQTLYRYELSSPRELTRLIENVDELSLTPDGTRILYRSGRDWALVPSSAAPEPGAGRIDTAALQIEVDPALEWRQIYHEAWRLMGDYFYDPDYHGQDLQELERHYAAYLPTITRRRDLNLLLGKALGHISVSHLGVDGGDLPRPAGERSRTGMLGADYTISEGRYRFARIYRSGHFNSESPLAQAPLDQPGVHVRVGDYLLQVDGEDVRASRNLYSYFAGKALQPVKITVGSDPFGAGSRTYTVIPLPGENTLRRWNWAERNRQIVEEESQGVLGYVYVPDFSARGLVAAFRQLLENTDRRGLVIDQRFAGGGITADYLIEVLKRRPLYYYMFRQGDDLPVPTNPMPEPKVLLINEANASAAETFALMFKLGNLGRTIGTRTWGAGIGPYVYIPPLIDGGRLSIPNRAAFDPSGSWAIENTGIEPDIEVPWLPVDWQAGRDPQLQAAIKTALQAIIDRPPLEVIRPDYPVYIQEQQQEQQ